MIATVVGDCSKGKVGVEISVDQLGILTIQCITHIFSEQYVQVDPYHTSPSMGLHTSAGLIFLLFTGCQPLFKLGYKQKAAKFRLHLKGITESPSYMADTN